MEHYKPLEYYMGSRVTVRLQVLVSSKSCKDYGDRNVLMSPDAGTLDTYLNLSQSPLQVLDYKGILG